jgi:guanylate kinase
MLRPNVEFKAYWDRPLEEAAPVCEAVGASRAGSCRQTTTYFTSRFGRLALRTNEPGSAVLLSYERTDMPEPRESRSQATEVSHPQTVHDILAGALGVRCTIEKTRESFQAGAATVHVDEVRQLGRFLDVTIDAHRAGGTDRALQVAGEILDGLGLSRADIVPWSYAELMEMSAAALSWRQRLPRPGSEGRLFLFDGASCSGKSTLVGRLTAESAPGAVLVPRYSTREPRPDDLSRGEYIFASREAFRGLALSGGFIEYRDFQFGMSYGLPWAEAWAPLAGGRHALGIINLGNIRHVKTILPEAVTILVDASEETIRQRLISRGVNTPEQIDERLANAARVQSYRHLYDHVVLNEDGTLREAEAFLRDLILEAHPQT